MIKNFDVLADRLKGIKFNDEEISPSKLQELLADEKEVELIVEQGSFMTDTDLDAFKERIGRESAKTGAKTIIEMEVKRFRNDMGLEFEGKTIENLINAVKENTLKEAKVPADNRIKELQSSLEKVQGQWKQEIADKDKIIAEKDRFIKSSNIDNDLFASMPKELKGITQKQAVTLFKSEYELDYVENEKVVKQNGVVLKDKFEKPIPYTDVINEFVAKNNWLNGEGRGGDSDKKFKSGFKDKNEMFKYMEDNNIDIESPQGQQIIEKFYQ